MARSFSMQAFYRELVKAGLVQQEELMDISRIVIDIKAGELPHLYIDKFGEPEKLARIAPMLADLIPEEIRGDTATRPAEDTDQGSGPRGSDSHGGSGS